MKNNYCTIISGLQKIQELKPSKMTWVLVLFLTFSISSVFSSIGYSQAVQPKLNLENKQAQKNRDIIIETQNVNQQEPMISGKVMDSNGQSLPGATVFVKGTTKGTVTDTEGNYSISNVSPGDTLVFSFVGMVPREIMVGNQTRINVTMQEDAVALQEVVAIGYGSVKKSSLSGAVSIISNEDLNKLPSANLSQALQGNASGLYSSQSNRSPGSSVSLTLRGENSFIGGSPLFVVDGFPLATEEGVNSINPNDIESISVLKDASSTAIYGARAANGVILITTKSAKTGTTSLEIDAYAGIKQFKNPIKTMNAQQFSQLRKDSYMMDGVPIPSNAFLPTELQMLESRRSTNWWKEVTGENKMTQHYQVSFFSGTDKTKIYVGGSFYDEQGIVNNTDFIRGALRFNASQKIGNNFIISSFNNISLMSQKGTDQTSVLFPAMVGNPMSPVKDDEGNYYSMIQNALGTPRANPVAFSELPERNSINPLLNSTLSLEFKIFEGLKIKSQISGELNSYRQNFYNPKAISAQDEVNGRISDGYARITSSVNYNWMSETTLMFNQSFNQIHSFDGVIGFSFQQNRYENLIASASGFVSDVYETYNLGASYGNARKPSSNLIEWNMLSYVGRIIYSLQSKYILTLNMRIDGSSRFGENNKYGYFPSAAIAWNISEERFMDQLNWLSDMKLRASYGLSGNANAISPYQTLSKLSYAPYNFNNKEVAGYYESNLPSPNLKWESTHQTDLGIDFSVFNRRLSFTFDYYYKKTNDLIRSVNLPAVSGFPSTYINLGNLENKGLEFGLNSVNFDSDFIWKTSFILSSNKNKLTSLGDGSDRIGTQEWVGKPLGSGSRYMVKAIGIWQTDEAEEAKEYNALPGDVRYLDLNSDKKIDDKDRNFYGSNYPDFYGSLTNDLSYKNFDLNIFMTFSKGRDVYNGNNYILLSGNGVDNNRIEMLNRWTPEKPSDKYPRASATSSNRLSVSSTEFLEDASYMKFKNITLGYSFHNSLKNIGILKNFRIYASIIDPFVFTNFSGMDPEDNDIGNTDRRSSYPITTTYMIGLQVKF